MAARKSNSRALQAWFCTTGLPSDVSIEVVDTTFHLHKFPLMSKSGKLHRLITLQETNHPSATVQTSFPATEGDGEDNGYEREIQEEVQHHCHISLPEFPGGSATFEIAAKFCYGVKIKLTPSNVAPLLCAGEALGMTEEYSENNLITRTETFLFQSVLKSLRDSTKALKSCEQLMPQADTLGIVQSCIDSVAASASASSNDKTAADVSSWYEELSLLGLPLFKRLIFAFKARDLSPTLIETCLVYYSKTHIPGIPRSNRKPSSSIVSDKEQRQLVETITANLPLPSETTSSPSTATRFLFGLYRTANILNASESCRATLERKIGLQLEQAKLDDILLPSYSYLSETLYDVDYVQRILDYFLESFEDRVVAGIENGDGESAALMSVGKLIDGYLSEIASDINLKPEKFCQLAVALPDHARLFNDGLYRAVDVYLKAHPWISEAEREKICGVMDHQKLTLEACTHAAQNERLPLRAALQVLFQEQVQLRQAIAGTLLSAGVAPASQGRPSTPRREEEGEADAHDSGDTWRAAVRENQVLRLDMDSMRTRVHELERECFTMKKAIRKIDETGPPVADRGWRRALTRKFGCKLNSQVCDSHEPTVVPARKGRNQHHHHQ